MRTPELSSERLQLRAWRAEDRAPFAALNADPVVMQHFPAPLSRDQSDAIVERIDQHFAMHGYGLWALELRASAAFLGFTGLVYQAFTAPFAPCVEIGWRLTRDAWGHGYASEAARATLRFAFDTLRLPEIVSFTVPHNLRSRRVMERIGMQHDPDADFDHPLVAEGHPLRHHVLYRLSRKQWRRA